MATSSSSSSATLAVAALVGALAGYSCSKFLSSSKSTKTQLDRIPESLKESPYWRELELAVRLATEGAWQIVYMIP